MMLNLTSTMFGECKQRFKFQAFPSSTGTVLSVQCFSCSSGAVRASFWHPMCQWIRFPVHWSVIVEPVKDIPKPLKPFYSSMDERWRIFQPLAGSCYNKTCKDSVSCADDSRPRGSTISRLPIIWCLVAEGMLGAERCSMRAVMVSESTCSSFNRKASSWNKWQPCLLET